MHEALDKPFLKYDKCQQERRNHNNGSRHGKGPLPAAQKIFSKIFVAKMA